MARRTDTYALAALPSALPAEPASRSRLFLIGTGLGGKGAWGFVGVRETGLEPATLSLGMRSGATVSADKR